MLDIKKKKFRASFVIVLYGKEVTQSKTFNKMLNFWDLLYDCKITLWNNGPKLLIDKTINIKKNVEIDVVETIDNIGLAKIYNTVINHNDSERYIILDDDSSLSEEYLKGVLDSRLDEVCLPIIKSGDVACSPVFNDRVIEECTVCDVSDKVMAIGSGIVIGEQCAEILKKAYKQVFDERFLLYGVDATFCYRISNLKLGSKIKVIPGFNHDLSRLSNSEEDNSSFRKKERSYDLGLQLRFYYRPHEIVTIFFKYFINDILKFLKVKEGGFLFFSTLKTFLIGKHYRSK